MVKPKFKDNASYFIAGGIGGIGWSTAFWMASNGAKNIFTFSRSTSNPNTRSFVAGLGKLACRVVTLSCDATHKDDLSKALRTCENQGLPAIRSVVHAAMVLRDSILENMTIDDGNAALGPEVAATWNLHSCISQPGSLDFFVLLPSLLVIFSWPSQPNYASGGAHEDAIARFQVTRALPAVSLDIGAVVNVGNEALTVTNKLTKSG